MSPPDTPIDDPDRTLPQNEATFTPATPISVGNFTIIGKLGEGGMGVVYEAEQQNPRRKVALKVVRGGHFVDEQRIKMFQREADTLARLDHPNIGAIYESGRTDEGRHFFAMELVRGLTLNDYLRGRPTVREGDELNFRLSLFRKIASAVHYAHQRGVIHRDLKPSNIVVPEDRETTSSCDGETVLPEIKVLDFGLARITDGDIATASMTTEVGIIKGTLAYMSPEQARANPSEIDIRTDVYALGIVLFEMLTGRRPYDISSAPLVEAVRIICEEPPSTLGGSTPRGFDGDIETIVGKALAKEASERYESAAAMSEDVHRYLASQPILARPPSTIYQLRKFAARNRTLVGGVIATFVVLMAGVVVSTTLGIREAAQRRLAERAQLNLRTVVDFQTDMLLGIDAERMGQSLVTDLRDRLRDAGSRAGMPDDEIEKLQSVLDGVNGTTAAIRLLDVEILKRAGESIEKQEDIEPLIAAELHGTLAGIYQAVGLLDDAESHRRTEMEICAAEQGEDHPRALQIRSDLAMIVSLLGRDGEAEPLLRETLKMQRQLLGPDDPDVLQTLGNLGSVREAQGAYEEAVELHRKAREGRLRVFGENSAEALESHRNVAYSLAALGEFEEAESLLTHGIDLGRSQFGEDNFGTLSAMNNLATIYEQQDRFDEAEEIFREVLAIRQRTVGDEHLATLVAKHNLATAIQNQGRPEKAEALHAENLATRTRVLGAEHPNTLLSLWNLALTIGDLGRDEEADRLFVRALDGKRRVYGAEHPETVKSLIYLGIHYDRGGRHREGERFLMEAYEIQRSTLAADDPDLLFTMVDLGNARKSLGDYDGAELLYSEARSALRAQGYDVGIVSYNMACLSVVRGDYQEALGRLRQSVEDGFYHADHMAGDSELESLRTDPAFDEIVALARESK